ncbi:unnamed protein product [Brassicogethes aeneus]|uniref:Uncharacterized protein n=1 Tax=Brassicogethes aeneus TaxID=1431903 RepID=A0A9P0B972_BRAAE|nr:unnamed protein product [Brassicogethes aeneus]
MYRKKQTFSQNYHFCKWMLPYYIKGLKDRLDVTDLFQHPKTMCSEKLGTELEKYWSEELHESQKNQRNPNLSKTLKKIFFKQYLVSSLHIFLEVTVFRTLATLSMSIFIKMFSEGNADKNTEKYITATVYWMCNISFIILAERGYYKLEMLSIKVRVALSSLIFRKMLKLNQKSLGQTSAGHMVNLLSNDLNRVEIFVRFSSQIFIAPLHLFIITYLSWIEVGVSCLAGILFVVLVSLPMQGYIGMKSATFRSKVASKSDIRTKFMNEIVSGIKVIKMYAWEKPFEKIVEKIRRQEMNYVYRSFLLSGLPFHTHSLIHKFTVFLIIITCFFLSIELTAANIFTTVQYMNLIRYTMLIMFPTAVLSIAQSKISFKRIEEFLLQEEITDFIEKQTVNTDVYLTNIHASWSPNSIVLNIPNFHIPNGKLCTIVGPVGSGKSSLLQILLGELKPISGTVEINNSLSYCSQEPWLFCSSVKNNILFGQEYKEEKYREIVNICHLNKDFHIFPHGDQTLVGERGVMLSGGQRARINLARALYKEAEVYLLDDPLSAVDTHVGRHLFDECLLRYLKGKTRILMTHQLQYLKESDVICVMNNGKIEASGSFDDLKDGNLDFTRFLPKIENESDNLDNRSKTPGQISLNKLNIEHCMLAKEQETIPEKINSFKEYVKAGGSTCFIFFFILVTLLAQVAYNFSDYWLIWWTDNSKNHIKIEIININKTKAVPSYQSDKRTNHSLTNSEISLIAYGVTMMICIILTILRIYLTSKFICKASNNLHKKMFNSLLKAPMRFFSTNPSGRILNRFSKDIGATDQLLPAALLESSQVVLLCTGGLVLICLSSYYVVIFVVLFLACMYLLFSRNVRIAAQFKHLEGITKSPIFTHVNYSLMGLTTIRANKSEEKLIQQFDTHQNTHTSAEYLTISSGIAFAEWLELLCIILNVCLPYALILINQYAHPVQDSFVGLALSQSLAFNGMLPYGIKRCTDACNYFTSVARILSYTKLEEETLENPKHVILKQTWPCYGEIEFRNLYLKYSKSDDAVLKNISFIIGANQKIGVVGRTGAGKSSLITALFRLADVEGTITIDNVNISEIGLTNLRRKISIIPQEPVLFSETVRYNLDPFQEFKDDEIWEVIEEVNMKGAVVSLDDMVLEGGSNFSIGQKQLLCLARALLRKNKILVLDEATANVDLRTDELIQKTIKTKFCACTVITIAHRLNTIMDSDKVMVMDGGELVEFAHPYILLKNEKSIFHSLVLETGVAMMQQLKQIAYNEYHSKVQVYKF